MIESSVIERQINDWIKKIGCRNEIIEMRSKEQGGGIMSKKRKKLSLAAAVCLWLSAACSLQVSAASLGQPQVDTVPE